jgi:hypothetical protein
MLVVHLDLQNDPIVIFRGLGEDEKKPETKTS